MNKRILVFPLFFLLMLSRGVSQPSVCKPPYSVALDSAKGKKLLAQCSRVTPNNIKSYWKATTSDVQLLEHNFKRIKKLISDKRCSPGSSIKNLNKYGFQYIGVTIKDKRYIYINAFYIDTAEQVKTFYKNWETEPLIMCDGGDWYWGVLFDLDKLKFKDLMINGVASTLHNNYQIGIAMK